MIVVGMFLFEKGRWRIKLVNQDEIVMHHTGFKPGDVEVRFTRHVML
jgi:hypothetical protein